MLRYVSEYPSAIKFPPVRQQVEAQVVICTVKRIDTHVLICHSCLSQVLKLCG